MVDVVRKNDASSCLGPYQADKELQHNCYYDAAGTLHPCSLLRVTLRPGM